MKAAVDAWLRWTGTEGRGFRSMRKGSRIDGTSMTDRAVAMVVDKYAGGCCARAAMVLPDHGRAAIAATGCARELRLPGRLRPRDPPKD